MSWSWLSSDPVECFLSPEVELLSSTDKIHRALNFTSRNNSIEFNISDLDCNIMYLSRVRAILRGIRLSEDGNEIFFGGNKIIAR